jgi:hypothetical protein
MRSRSTISISLFNLALTPVFLSQEPAPSLIVVAETHFRLFLLNPADMCALCVRPICGVLVTTISLRSEVFARGARMLRTALGPAISGYLEDPSIVEVILNPDGRLWIDRLSGRRAARRADRERHARGGHRARPASVDRGRPHLAGRPHRRGLGGEARRRLRRRRAPAPALSAAPGLVRFAR